MAIVAGAGARGRGAVGAVYTAAVLRVAVGQGEGQTAEALAAAVIEPCRAQLGGVAPSAGILYVAADVDVAVMAAVVASVAAAFPGIALIGGSTAGDLSSAFGFSEDSATLIVFAGDGLALRAGLGEGLAADPARAVASALAMAGVEQEAPALCVALVDAGSGRSELAVAALAQGLPATPLVGGTLAYPWGSSREVAVFFGDRVLTDAVAVLAFAGPIAASIQVHNGWRPVGPRQVVSESRGREVLRIGERSALDFYRHYLGDHLRPAFEFPLAIYADGGERFVLRVPQSYDAASGSVLYSATVPEGAEVQLTEYVRGEVMAGTEASAAATRGGLGEAPPAFALVISCASRKQVLGTRIAEEVAIVRRALPQVPFAGFYAFGEVAPLAVGGRAHYHNSTLVIALIGVRGGEVPTEPMDMSEWAGSKELARAPAPPTVEALARKLVRSERYRARLEETKELQTTMLRTIGAEIEAARVQIASQNDELRRLYGELAREQQKSEELLLNILPRDVAAELKRTGRVEPVFYESVSVLFTDFQGFTRIASALSPSALIHELDRHFSAFDAIIERHGLEKLKTIGDAYMCAAGIPTPRADHALLAARAAWDMQAYMRASVAEQEARGEPCWRLRIGIHSGPLMAGVIGHKKFAYDIWGDTVNVASRLESTGEPGRINVSAATAALIRGEFACEARGRIAIKNAGEIDMFFASRRGDVAGASVV